jgi:hypothetical protein
MKSPRYMNVGNTQATDVTNMITTTVNFDYTTNYRNGAKRKIFQFNLNVLTSLG